GRKGGTGSEQKRGNYFPILIRVRQLQGKLGTEAEDRELFFPVQQAGRSMKLVASEEIGESRLLIVEESRPTLMNQRTGYGY
ncbi:hypothetical protein LINPERPRIM_LOCUS15, partial [Linum perenne]